MKRVRAAAWLASIGATAIGCSVDAEETAPSDPTAEAVEGDPTATPQQPKLQVQSSTYKPSYSSYGSYKPSSPSSTYKPSYGSYKP